MRWQHHHSVSSKAILDLQFARAVVYCGPVALPQ
jgi:hypothetical protein